MAHQNRLKDIEVRSECQEIRQVGEEGFFEGYAAVWNTIDSYGTEFQRGCFKKTMDERGSRIKILWNHEKNAVIGKVIEWREDDYGFWVRGRLNMAVRRAQETHALMSGDDPEIDTLSFGFNTIKDKVSNGRRIITEVRLYEVSPVTFEANPMAKVINVRDEERSTDFDETEKTMALSNKSWQLLNALESTLSDIWWTLPDGAAVIDAVSKALDAFKSQYEQWAQEFVDVIWNEKRALPGDNALSKAVFEILEGRKIDEVVLNSSLTMSEFRTLMSGKVLPLEAHGKLAELGDAVVAAHQQTRAAQVEALCDEFRAKGFTDSESIRFKALLSKNEPDIRSKPSDDLLQALETLRITVRGK